MRPMAFTIRPAAPRDLAELKRMRIALDELLSRCDPRVWRLSDEFAGRLDKFYADIIAKDANRIYVACDEADRPVGMLMVRILDSPNINVRRFGRIDDAWVEPAFRRQGMMHALTRAACRFLKERGVGMVMLDWANNNPPSGECWQELGFEPLLTMGFTTPGKVLEGGA